MKGTNREWYREMKTDCCMGSQVDGNFVDRTPESKWQFLSFDDLFFLWLLLLISKLAQLSHYTQRGEAPSNIQSSHTVLRMNSIITFLHCIELRARARTLANHEAKCDYTNIVWLWRYICSAMTTAHYRVYVFDVCALVALHVHTQILFNLISLYSVSSEHHTKMPCRISILFMLFCLFVFLFQFSLSICVTMKIRCCFSSNRQSVSYDSKFRSAHWYGEHKNKVFGSQRMFINRTSEQWVSDTFPDVSSFANDTRKKRNTHARAYL